MLIRKSERGVKAQSSSINSDKGLLLVPRAMVAINSACSSTFSGRDTVPHGEQSFVYLL